MLKARALRDQVNHVRLLRLESISRSMGLRNVGVPRREEFSS
jgi:hypothetical protein